MADSKYRDILKRLMKVSESLPWRTVARPLSAKTSSFAQMDNLPSLSLHTPSGFLEFLHNFNLSPSTLRATQSRIYQAVDEQKALHEKKYRESCNKISQFNVPSSSSSHIAYYQSMKRAHEKSFIRQLERIKSETLEILQRHWASSQPTKVVFNAEYTPVLEQYFEYNAYPSARDRELLARKSSMTPRQIEVWFQNHRRRARKEGRHLKRITTDPLPTELSLNLLKEQMPAFMIRKEERRSPSIDVKDIPAEPIHKLPSPAPTHVPTHATSPKFSLDDISSSSSALPALYAPQNRATLFSISHSFTFEAPVWYRKALSPTSSSRSAPVQSVDDLCSEFRSKLYLGGAGSIRKQKDCKHLSHAVATRRRFTIAPHPLVAPAVKPSPRTAASPDISIKFGSTSLHSFKRHHPYDLSSRSRRHPSWTLDKPATDEFRTSTPSRLSTRRQSSIPRTPSLSSISSSSDSSSYYSNPPTPRDSPSSSSVRPLPVEHDLYAPYTFDFSANTVYSSYPSSTERSTSYSHSKSHPSSSSHASASFL